MENVEQIAREYREALANEDNTAIEQIVLLEENQLDALNDLNGSCSALTVRTVGYLKNLIFRSLQEVNTLLGNTSYIPSIQNRTNRNSPRNTVLSLYDMQISIFVLADKINTLPASFLDYENRKLSFIVALLK